MNNNNNLNELIFKQLSIYLIYNNLNSFESILSLSLISKSTFKSFQNLLISYPLNKNLFIIPKITQFIKYINNQNDDDDEDYKFKLIQYKEIKEIKFNNLNEIYEDIEIFSQLSRLELPTTTTTRKKKNKLTFIELLEIEKKNELGKENYQPLLLNQDTDRYDHPFFKKSIISIENSYFNQSRIKWFLNLKCPELNKIIINKTMKPIHLIPFDFTFNGFYQVNKLSMNWSYDNPPQSSYDDGIEEEEQNDDDDDEQQEDDGYGGDYDELSNLIFSFKFLQYYSPIKLEFGTDKSTRLYLCKGNFDNILKCKSIESISHNSYISDGYLVKNSISSNSPIIKSLHVEIFGESIIKFLNAIKNSNFTTSNKTLNKLLIDGYFIKDDDYFKENSNELIFKLFELLKLNSSITVLGLNYFKIKDHSLLLPLIEIKNIKKLYTNLKCLNSILNHCNKNQNIKVLNIIENHNDNDDKLDKDEIEILKKAKVKLLPKSKSYSKDQLQFYLLLQFLQNNTSSIHTIKICSLNLKNQLESSITKLNIKLAPNIILSK